MAVNCCVAPTEIDGLVGNTFNDSGIRIAQTRAFDTPPPGAGLVTVTDRERTPCMSAGVIMTVSWVELTNVVVGVVPLTSTIDAETKPVPFKVSVKALPSAIAFEGDSELRAGTGLFI